VSRQVAARLRASLVSKVPRDHRESDRSFRRRRLVVAVTGLVGSTLLQRSLSRPPGSRAFYGHALAVAGTWVAGGVAAGPLHLGRELSPHGQLRRPVLVPVATGTAAFGALYGCALVARRIPVLAHAVSDVLAYAERGDSAAVLATTLVNGAAEEVFFRGALYAAVGDGHQVAVSTAAYTFTTVTTRNPALVLAAAGMGTLFGLQRRASGGIQAPALTHLVWSALVLRYLPPLFREGRSARH
jgi:membrane protease YdiL (CAAX protease family)